VTRNFLHCKYVKRGVPASTSYGLAQISPRHRKVTWGMHYEKDIQRVCENAIERGWKRAGRRDDFRRSINLSARAARRALPDDVSAY